MRLVSLNTWKGEGDYPRRVRAMIDGLAALTPDVIALQEDLRTRDGLTHTALDIARALHMHLSWVPARPKARTVGLRHAASTSGLAVLSRLPVTAQRVVALPEDSRDGQRLAQCVMLPVESGDCWLVNLHLTHLPDRADLRRSQLEHVLLALDGFAPGEPAVLCGDFNAAPDDPELSGFLQPEGPLVSVFAGQDKTTHWSAQGQALDLDHIFLHIGARRSPGTANHARVVLDEAGQQGVFPSDHRAVCVDLA